MVNSCIRGCSDYYARNDTGWHDNMASNVHLEQFHIENSNSILYGVLAPLLSVIALIIAEKSTG